MLFMSSFIHHLAAAIRAASSFDRGSDNIMRLLSTHVFGDRVQLRFESTLPSGEAIEWMEIWVKHETDECQPLATIQREALERAQNVINSEIQRLRALAGLGVRQ